MSSPLPGATDGPTSPERVAALLPGVNPADVQLQDAVAALNTRLRRWLAPGSDGAWDADHVQGATMLAARVYRRRNSAGVVEFSAAGDPVYVQRNDPDVAMLLGIGPYAAPQVG